MSTSQTYLSQIRQSGDRMLLCVVGVLLVMALALAPLYDTWTEALVIGLPTAAVVAWLVAAHPGALVTRCNDRRRADGLHRPAHPPGAWHDRDAFRRVCAARVSPFLSRLGAAGGRGRRRRRAPLRIRFHATLGSSGVGFSPPTPASASYSFTPRTRFSRRRCWL